ncbi:MAG TPA: S1 RNA-binding domain-containing protein, partial [Blastocatellia bacterium]|nr:S1 RNA-binding domain-containing protein [Blastocatellia bacterium]
MSTNNPNQPATGASEAQESTSAAESAQPIAASESAAVESAAATVPGKASATPDGDHLEAEGAENGDLGLEDFGKILAEHEQSHRSEISENEVVKGRVVKITDQAVIIDVGFKSEGIVPIAEFKDGDQITVQPGDDVDVYVKQLENSEGYVELSRADAVRMQTWDQIEYAYKQGTNIIGRVTDRIKGGLRVDIGGIQAFLPGSQVDIRPVRNLDSFRNKEIEIRVL